MHLVTSGIFAACSTNRSRRLGQADVAATFPLWYHLWRKASREDLFAASTEDIREWHLGVNRRIISMIRDSVGRASLHVMESFRG